MILFTKSMIDVLTHAIQHHCDTSDMIVLHFDPGKLVLYKPKCVWQEHEDDSLDDELSLLFDDITIHHINMTPGVSEEQHNLVIENHFS